MRRMRIGGGEGEQEQEMENRRRSFWICVPGQSRAFP